MENKANFMKRENRAKAGENRTRLQEHAPASLELDEVFKGRPTNPFASSTEASKAIPLLSPLILSPQQLPETTETRMPEISNNERRSNEITRSSSMTSNGWQHPAMVPLPEPSSLFSSLRKQCVIVDQAQ